MARLRILIGLLVAVLTWRNSLSAQFGYAQRLPLKIVQVPRYEPNALSVRPYTCAMDFAGAQIIKTDLPADETTGFSNIDLVFTLYPRRPEDWKVGYDSLMERRFRTLESRIPNAFRDKGVQWRLVIQTGCKSQSEARALFHGFVLYPAAPSPVPEVFAVSTSDTLRALRFDTVKLREKFTLVNKILSGEKVLPDSTVIKVFDRHPEWKNALVVVDWTASMYRQGALLVRWQQEHLAESRIRHFVFFNDGDQHYDDEKIVGQTGGIYETAADSLHRMMATIEAVTLGGDGGDHRENDIEAILEGIASCPTCEQVVLIADNTGPVRDMALLDQLDLPVRVLLCNVYKDEIETDYLQVADQTGGSLHTRDRDLQDMDASLVKGILTVGDKQYTRKGKRWMKYEPRF